MTDQSINPVSVPSTAGQMGKKPAHLIVLSKGKQEEFFVALDKPDFSSAQGFVLARGFVIGGCNEEKIKTNYAEFISSAVKEEIEEVYFPAHRVVNVKSLVYRAK